MKIKPQGERFLATKILDDKPGKDKDLEVPGTNASLDKFTFAKVFNGGDTVYKKDQIVVIPSYCDVINNQGKEFYLAHTSDVVAICE